MRKILFVVAISSFIGCAMVTPSYVGDRRPAHAAKDVTVYFRADDVPYPYRILGKVYLKNINYWADRDPGAQARTIQGQAAQAGADGVIINEDQRFEASTESAAQVYQLNGTAIVRKD